MLRATAKSLLGSRKSECRPLQSILVSAFPTAVRHASLSAIHRGLRRSESAEFGGTRYSRSRDSRGRTRDSYGSDRSAKALDGASSSRQQQKLRKKLDRKASTAEDEDDGRQTRRKRFLDPTSSFGKRSLVYQLKYGSLKDTAASLKIEEPVRPRRLTSHEDEPGRQINRDQQSSRQPWNDQRQERDQQTSRQPWNDQRRENDQKYSRQPWNDQRHERDQQTSRQPWNDQRRENDQKYSRQPWNDQRREDDRNVSRRPWNDQRREDGQNSSHQPWNDQRHERDHERDRNERDNYRHINERDATDATNDAPAYPKKRGMMPMTITYTTAASQFLYGKSVVKAALEQTRRQLYKLYVYGGENRRDFGDHETVMTLAKAQGVPVVTVPAGDQRLMDKMSMGRPHNGLILETSPLPQLPIKSLGRLEETPSRLGFHVELDHQTAEQRSINGQDTFVRKAVNSASKPLVLLLHEILDPGNLGALLRTASYMGIDAVGITSRGSSHLTPVVLKSSAGAAEEVTIFTVNSPVEFLEASRAMGWKTYSAVAPPEKKLVKIHRNKFISADDIEQNRPLDQHPCILVLGNEGHGLPRQVKVATDFEVSVPRFVQGSSVDSLNVSVAAGLLCHSFIKEPSRRSVAKNMGFTSQQAVQPKELSQGESVDKFF